MKKILWAVALIPALSVAETIEVKDAEKAIEIYSLFGAASICANSDKLTLEERYEVEKIEENYNNIRRQHDLKPSRDMQHQASSEIFGIKRGSDPSYKKCMQALKK